MRLPDGYIATIRQAVENELRDSTDDQGVSERCVHVDGDDLVYAWRDGRATIHIETPDREPGLGLEIVLDATITVRDVRIRTL